ncbi:CRISPR-associated protein Cas4 [Streptomyces sp. NPDC058368]|uniref:CRISPR-associated protein Cas4 n=1 Tax=Streptomyces sp. NPDC058368 TaxID=3346461 RepID=UPI003652F594
MTTPHPPKSGEGDLTQVSLSSLEHYAYCPRQAGLILLEQTWTDDAATIRGTLLHQRVDTPGNQARGTIRTLHALPVWNDQHGLTGVCDTVELHADSRVLPIEHKSGRYVPGGPGDLQAAAQAMCLEEMFSRPVPQAVVYSGTDRRRHTIPIDETLRSRVLQTAQQVRNLLDRGELPRPPADRRCKRCSLATDCMPKLLTGTGRYQDALTRLYCADDQDNA